MTKVGGKGNEHPNWKGGLMWSAGYAYIWKPGYHRCPNSHPNHAKRADVVLEEKIGRLLEPSEVAHHKNRNRADDSPDNLEVKSRREHKAEHNVETARTVLRSDNVTGVTGVCWDTQRQKFKGRMMVNGHRKFFGYFDTVEEAQIARDQFLERFK